MKRGVPPTARNARTGELTPPGMTRRARSNSSSLVIGRGPAGGDSVDVARILGRGDRFGFAAAGDIIARLAVLLALTRQRPEEAIGNDVAHARAKAGVERLVEEGERFADGGVQLDAGREQRGECGRERLAGADEGRLEALEFLA